jgi:hypothetical protein
LGDVGEILAVVLGHRIVEGGRPALGDLLSRPQQRVGQPRAEDWRADALPDVAEEGGPFLERGPFAAEAGRIPDPAALQPHEQHRGPPVGAFADGPAGDRHGPVDLAVLCQRVEERGNEPGHGLHADVALHGDDGRDAGLGEPRAQRGQRPLVLAPGLVARPGALAGCQDDQPRWPLQLAQPVDEDAPGDPVDPSGVVLQQQL